VPTVSVVVPAYNEELLLPKTLERITTALSAVGWPSEIIVVDNDSRDRTRAVAESFGARVCQEQEHNIAAVRNTGARNAAGDLLVFIDADTLVPETLFTAITAVMEDARCFGGAVAVGYDEFQRRWMRAYLAGWKFWGKVFNMAQGAAQFCRRSVFQELGGYDPTIFVGEDIELYWRLARYARRHGGYVRILDHPKVITSTRRFDRMGLWKTLLLTHPVLIRLNWRKKLWWKDWYERAVR
jgi:glycosyltransferase involved in cell wall biosynthesis